jgi:hypothetical protein
MYLLVSCPTVYQTSVFKTSAPRDGIMVHVRANICISAPGLCLGAYEVAGFMLKQMFMTPNRQSFEMFRRKQKDNRLEQSVTALEVV